MIIKYWQKATRAFLSFPRSDRNAIVLISTLVLILITAIIIVRTLKPIPESDFTEIKAILEKWEIEKNTQPLKTQLRLFTFDPNKINSEELDSLDIPAFVKQNLIGYRKAGGVFKSTSDVQKIYGMTDSLFQEIELYIVIEKKNDNIKPKISIPKSLSGWFDPNTANEKELTKFGFNSFQIRNLINYRKKGGRIETPANLQKIYGVDSAFYSKIHKHIRINKTETETNNEGNTKQEAVELLNEISIELNTADSASLVQLSGIGASYAKRIIKYRNLLGGFYSKTQLTEIYNFPEETYNKIQLNIYVDTFEIEKIRINFAEFSELLRHPYINKTQVKEMLDKRENEGPINSVYELEELESFDSETIEKIRPYITCR